MLFCVFGCFAYYGIALFFVYCLLFYFFFLCLFLFFFFFFFFQAEDGIRDGTVTGVQTCALPILIRVFLAGFVLALAILAYGPSQAQTGSAQLAVQDASVKPIGKVVTTTGSDRKSVV